MRERFRLPHFELITAELSDDYKEVNGVNSEHYTNLLPPYTREAAPLPGKELKHSEKTCKATYVWLPVEWQGEKPVIKWHDEWRIEDYK